MPRLVLPFRRIFLRSYRLFWWPVLALAALYVITAVGIASKYTGIGPGAALFAARSLKADVFDVASVMTYYLGGGGLGIAERPTRYALICQEARDTNEAEVADWDKRLKFQIEHHTGPVWNSLYRFMSEGYRHPVIILQPGLLGVALVCPAHNYEQQTCACDSHRKAFHRGYFPVSVLTGAGKNPDEQ